MKHVHSLIADEVALLHFSSGAATAVAPTCDACGVLLEEEPFGKGLLFWSRDGELRWEEPGLCERCAHVIGLAALRAFAQEEDDS